MSDYMHPYGHFGGGHLRAHGRSRKTTLNNAEREQWIDNDEGLYSWWRSSGQSKRAFIKENKTEIDTAIQNVLGGNKPAHYLKYGPLGLAGVHSRLVHTIKLHDVGQPVIIIEGRPRMVCDFIGRILRQDVGKRIYETDGILQVENNEQLARRSLSGVRKSGRKSKRKSGRRSGR